VLWSRCDHVRPLAKPIEVGNGERIEPLGYPGLYLRIRDGHHIDGVCMIAGRCAETPPTPIEGQAGNELAVTMEEEDVSPASRLVEALLPTAEYPAVEERNLPGRRLGVPPIGELGVHAGVVTNLCCPASHSRLTLSAAWIAPIEPTGPHLRS
jgi:hypothetical protein